MLKIFVKLMALLVVLALAGPYLLHGPDGHPLMSLSDLKWPDFSFKLPGKHSAPTTAGSPATGDSPQNWIRWSRDEPPNPVQLTPKQLAALNLKAQDNIYYRWQDNNGTWQFSTVPNLNTVNYVVRTDPNANVLQNLSKEKIDQAFGRTSTGTQDTASTRQDKAPTLPIPTTIPLTQVPQLLQKAKDVQKLLNQRAKKMDAMIESQ